MLFHHFQISALNWPESIIWFFAIIPIKSWKKHPTKEDLSSAFDWLPSTPGEDLHCSRLQFSPLASSLLFGNQTEKTPLNIFQKQFSPLHWQSVLIVSQTDQGGRISMKKILSTVTNMEGGWPPRSVHCTMYSVHVYMCVHSPWTAVHQYTLVVEDQALYRKTSN